MEYGLWNLPTGFWQSGGQGNIPVDAMGRPYYNPANGLPPGVFHNNLNEGDVSHYAVTNSQSYRHQTEYAAKNGPAGRHPTQDDKSQLEGLLPMTGEAMEPRQMESFPPEAPPQVTVTPVIDDKKHKHKGRNASPGYEQPEPSNGHPAKSDPTLEYLKQQSYQHPMYGMIYSQLTNKNEPAHSDTEENEEGRPRNTAPSVYNEDSQSTSCRSPSNGDAQSCAGYECGECGLVAETRPSLKKHIAQSHPEPHLSDGVLHKMPDPNACPMTSCRFRSTEKEELEAHISRHVSEGFSGNSKKKGCPIALQRVRYEREEYRCQMCAYSCTIEKAFYKHLKVHTIGHQNGPIKISCVICGKDRTSEVDMNKHMKKHRDDRYFCCDICIFKTVQLKKLIQHRRMHTGEKPHLCPHCSYRSARRDNLRSHVRRVHKKENLYCDTFSPRGLLVTPSVPTADSPVPAPTPELQE